MEVNVCAPGTEIYDWSARDYPTFTLGSYDQITRLCQTVVRECTQQGSFLPGGGMFCRMSERQCRMNEVAGRLTIRAILGDVRGLFTLQDARRCLLVNVLNFLLRT